MKISSEQFNILIEDIAYEVWENIPGNIISNMSADEKEMLSRNIRKGLRKGLGFELDYLIERPISESELSRKHMSGVEIKDTDLPIRIKNVLFEMGFTTIGSLEQLSKFRFLHEPNAGKKSLFDLETFLGRPLTSEKPTTWGAYPDKRKWNGYVETWKQNN